MNKGYHQYGIEWEAHPVNLGPMREEVKRSVAEENRKREARCKDDPNFLAANASPPGSEPKAAAAANIPKPTAPPVAQAAVTPTVAAAPGTDLPVVPATAGWSLRLLFLALVLLCAGGYAMYHKRRQSLK